jgi:hypothetical protein
LKCHKPSTSYFDKDTIKKVITSNEQYRLEFISAKVQKDLAKYGVVPRKTSIALFPQALLPDFYP